LIIWGSILAADHTGGQPQFSSTVGFMNLLKNGEILLPQVASSVMQTMGSTLKVPVMFSGKHLDGTKFTVST
jgi:hypothetical protein